MVRSASVLVASMVCWGVLSSSQSNAQQLVEKESLVKKTQKVQAVDTDGNPIADATFKPFGLNLSYFWPASLMGKPIDSISDKEGFVSLEYPQLFADSVQCKSIDCVVSHSEYVGAIARIPINATECQKVTLKKGIRFALKGIEIDGSPVKERFAALMSGDTAPSFRQVGTDGLIETKSAATGPHQVMLVQPRNDNKTRFSEALFFHFNDRDQDDGVVVDDVELLPGARVFGKLPSNIKRPIKEGVVIARQRPLPMKDANELGMRQLSWGDWTTIAEDGSFAFVSMPRSGKIQIIAMCDGWVSPGERMMTKGQTFTVSDDDLEVELELQPTMDGVIEVKDEAGTPIHDANVSFWPNELWEDYGSQILGQRSRSIDEAKLQMGLEQESGSASDRINAFSGKTDDKGRVVIRNLPSRFALPFMVEKKGFDALKRNLPVPLNSDGVETESAERLTSQIYVTLKKAESP